MIPLHEKSSLLFIHSQPIRIGCVVSSVRDSKLVQIEGWGKVLYFLFIRSQSESDVLWVLSAIRNLSKLKSWGRAVCRKHQDMPKVQMQAKILRREAECFRLFTGSTYRSLNNWMERLRHFHRFHNHANIVWSHNLVISSNYSIQLV